MQNDLITLSLIVNELHNKIIMAKVTKINQPENDEIRLFLRNNGENLTLAISSNPNSPGIRLTETKKVNPIACPNFCMLLRKYLTNSVITDISLQNNDRIIRLVFENKDELKYKRYFKLYVELINRYSNVIFVNDDDIILSAIKQIAIDGKQKRPIISGIKYDFLPVNAKSNILDEEELSRKTACITPPLFDSLTANFNGITKDTAKLLFYDLKDKKILSSSDYTEIIDTISEVKNGNILKKLSFYVKQTNGKEDYFYSFIKDLDYPEFNSLNEAYDYCQTIADKKIRLKERTKAYYNLINRYIAKTEKKIQININKLNECGEKDKYRIYGELLTANIFQLKKGMRKVTVKNYYNDFKDLEIALDEKLSPKENVALYYKRYNKLKKAEDVTKDQLEKNRNALEYAEAVLTDLDNLEYEDSIDDIKEELTAIDLLKENKKKNQKKERSNPYIYQIDGYTIIAGKNNLQNDELTFKIANSQDIWCHVKASRGSHVIAFRNNGDLPRRILQIALEIAGYYSADKSSKVEVDYTIRKNVSRKDKTHKGLVNYTNYQTALVTPDQHTEFLIKK